MSEPCDGSARSSPGAIATCVSQFLLMANARPPCDHMGLHQQGRRTAINCPSGLRVANSAAWVVSCGSSSPRRGRHFLPHNEWGFSEGRFGQRPAQSPGRHSAFRPDGSARAFRRWGSPAAGPFGFGCVLFGSRISGFRQPAPVWRDRRTLDDPSGRRPVPAPAWAYAGSGRLQW